MNYRIVVTVIVDLLIILAVACTCTVAEAEVRYVASHSSCSPAVAHAVCCHQACDTYERRPDTSFAEVQFGGCWALLGCKSAPPSVVIFCGCSDTLERPR